MVADLNKRTLLMGSVSQIKKAYPKVFIIFDIIKKKIPPNE